MVKADLIKLVEAKASDGKLGNITSSNLEKMSYLFDLFDKYGKFLSAVREEYNMAGSKSTWSVQKVCVGALMCALLILCIDQFQSF